MKKLNCLMLILVCGMCLMGCKDVKVGDVKKDNDKIVVDAKEEAKMETITLEIYDVVLDKVVTKTAEVKKISAKSIVDAYINEFCTISGCEKDMLPGIVSVMTSEDNEVIIDLDSIVNNMGSYGEAEYIDNMCNAIFSNMKDVNKVYITVNGGGYESGHLMWGADEPFLRPEASDVK